MPVRTCRPNVYWEGQCWGAPGRDIYKDPGQGLGALPASCPGLPSSPYQAEQAVQNSLKCSPTGTKNYKVFSRKHLTSLILLPPSLTPDIFFLTFTNALLEV